MKALSLRQPYAELIVSGRKTIELRSWKTKHRGKFLVHASKAQASRMDCEMWGFDPHQLQYGAILGSVELVDVKDYDQLPDDEWNKDSIKHLAGEEYRGSTKGFILKNAVKYDNPIPLKGQLQFFEVQLCNECGTAMEKSKDYDKTHQSENTQWYCPSCKAGTL